MPFCNYKMTVTLINRVYYEENEILVSNVTSRLRKFMQSAYFREAISKVKRNFDRSINIFRRIKASEKLFSILLSHSVFNLSVLHVIRLHLEHIFRIHPHIVVV